jgi:hypothetical protein
MKSRSRKYFLFGKGSGGAIPWYRSSSAPAPIAVYQPIGAASYAASLVNIVNPGTYDLTTGVEPAWASATGWTGTGTEYLVSPLKCSTNSVYAVYVRTDNVGSPGAYAFACGGSDASRSFLIGLRNGVATQYRLGGTVTDSQDPADGSGIVSDGTNIQAYRNGLAVGSPTAMGTVPNVSIYVLAQNNNGELSSPFIGNLLCIAFWSGANVPSAAQMLAVHTAAMALSG